MIKLGMIGGGVNSAVGAAHVAAMRMTGRFELVAGCFSKGQGEQGVNYASAIKYDAKHALSPESLLMYSPLDRVVVLSPTPDHFAHVNLCLDAKLSVLCEKALGVSSQETFMLCRDASPLSVVFNYAFYPAVQKLRELLRDGEFGEVTHVHAEMPQSGYLVGKPQPWRLSDFGVYLDLGTHMHHLVWFLTGAEPVSVHAVERRISDVGVVDYVSAQVQYPNFTAQMWFSKVSAGYTNGLRIRVFGTRGSAEWHQREPDVLRVASAEVNYAPALMEVPNPRFKLGHPTGFVEALANLYEAWADDPAHPDLSPAVAHEGLLLMEAMQRSATEEKEVML